MKPRTILGLVLIVAGAWKLANLWGLIENDWLWRQTWTVYITPVVLVYAGVMTLADSYRRNPGQWLQRPLPVGEEGKRLRCTVQFGTDEYVFRGEPFHGASLHAFCGGIRMDLRQALITEDEEIDIHTYLGGIQLIVSPTVNVSVRSRNFIGGVDNTTSHNPQACATIYIVADNFCGGVEVGN